MTPKIRNIIIFVIIAVIFVLIYIFFIKPPSPQANLISSPSTTLPNIDGSFVEINTQDQTSLATKDFLVLLSSVKSITLDDSIFSDQAFNSLRDSSIMLIPDGTEGRPNPFAQFGNDVATVSVPTCVPPQVLNVSTNTCTYPTQN